MFSLIFLINPLASVERFCYDMKGAGTRAALRSLVESSCEPGVLAYHDGVAIGWCALGPREDFTALKN